jgi:hypothetical protein
MRSLVTLLLIAAFGISVGCDSGAAPKADPPKTEAPKTDPPKAE